jgi:DEAD/DEAH box helicase domain-containing protein
MNGEPAPTDTVPGRSDHGSADTARAPGQGPAGEHEGLPIAHASPEDLLRLLVGDHPERLVHVHEVPARPARHGDWPEFEWHFCE